MEIWKPPKILIVHLKRFSFYNNRWIKSNRLVEFPIDGLDPRTWLVDPPIEPLQYDLYATVNHYGRLGGGHYTAYAKNRDDQQWYLFDDHHVKVLSDVTKTVSPAAYLLFYKVQDLNVDEVLTSDIPDVELDAEKLVGKLPKDREAGDEEGDDRGNNKISRNRAFSECKFM